MTKSERPESKGSNTEKERTIVSLPTLEYYKKTYANTMGDDDQKALRAFRDFESHEKLRRLQSELLWIKDDKVTEQALHRVVGKKRAHKFQSYLHWSELMLIWISQLKR